MKNVLKLEKYVSDVDKEKGLPSSNKKYTIFDVYDETYDTTETVKRIRETHTQGRCYVFPIEKFLPNLKVERLFKKNDTPAEPQQMKVPYLKKNVSLLIFMNYPFPLLLCYQWL